MFFLIGSWSLSLYNFLLAFVICGGVIIIGEVVSTLTKAWVPSVFVSAVLLLLGYWTILPHDLVKDSFLIPFGATLCIYLLITHLGTIISLKQLMQKWRTVTVCLAGLLGMCLACAFLYGPGTRHHGASAAHRRHCGGNDDADRGHEAGPYGCCCFCDFHVLRAGFCWVSAYVLLP